jgi:hypothetical protein
MKIQFKIRTNSAAFSSQQQDELVAAIVEKRDDDAKNILLQKKEKIANNQYELDNLFSLVIYHQNEVMLTLMLDLFKENLSDNLKDTLRCEVAQTGNSHLRELVTSKIGTDDNAKDLELIFLAASNNYNDFKNELSSQKQAIGLNQIRWHLLLNIAAKNGQDKIFSTILQEVPISKIEWRNIASNIVKADDLGMIKIIKEILPIPKDQLLTINLDSERYNNLKGFSSLSMVDKSFAQATRELTKDKTQIRSENNQNSLTLEPSTQIQPINSLPLEIKTLIAAQLLS